MRGLWQNDIPVLSDVVQLAHYKPTFPHQCPLPEVTIQDPAGVLKNQLDFLSAQPDFIRKKSSLSGNNTDTNPSVQSTEESYENLKAGGDVVGHQYDILKVLKEVEPIVAQITEPVVANNVANYLTTVEYLWRCTPETAENFGEPAK